MFPASGGNSVRVRRVVRLYTYMPINTFRQLFSNVYDDEYLQTLTRNVAKEKGERREEDTNGWLLRGGAAKKRQK